MRFSVSRTTEHGINLIELTDTELHVRVAVAPEHGAMLHAFSLPLYNRAYNVIDNYSDIHQLQSELAISFKSCKLSPFAARIKEGKYRYEDETIEFSNKHEDGTAIHGLLYNKSFAVVDEWANDHEAGALLKYNYKEEDDGYPFHYRCEVRYTLSSQAVLQVATTIINIDELSLPMADGWHPYFRLEGNMSDWLLYFNANTQLELDQHLLPTGRLLPYPGFSEETPIGNTVLNNCFLLNQDGNPTACTLRHPENGLQLHIFPDTSYPYIQIYTPPHRNSIAIENLSAAPDAFNNKMGLLLLKPGDTHTFTVHYQLTCE